MIRHIVMFSFKEGPSAEENRKTAEAIKTSCEALKNIIPGILQLDVAIDLMPGSTGDLAINSLFESAEALDAYQVHPEHMKVVELIRSAMHNRVCADYAE